MAKIYKLSDRIKLKIGELTVVISPLSLHDKNEATKMISKGATTADLGMTQDGLIHLLKSCVKDIIGLENADGSPYKLEFVDGKLTDECVSDLCNLEIHTKLLMVASSLVRGIPSEFQDQHGNKIEGVEIVQPEKQEPKSPN